MTCEKCVHYEICIFHITDDEYKKCLHFKNSDDFTEVVRCIKCKYLDDGEWCRLDGRKYGADHYCDLGERKDGEIK